jgi:protein-S-isoprenylcysteine O-methyltransferase Ste14
MNKKIFPPTYFFILLMLSVILHFVFPIMKIIPSPYNYLGILLVLFGIIINIWADRIFKTEKTTVKPDESPDVFILSGPFKFTRNPMYLGMLSILLGVAVFLGSLITFIFPVLFIVLMNLLFIPVEEKNLQKKFGKKYIDYKKKVRRWI